MRGKYFDYSYPLAALSSSSSDEIEFSRNLAVCVWVRREFQRGSISGSGFWAGLVARDWHVHLIGEERYSAINSCCERDSYRAQNPAPGTPKYFHSAPRTISINKKERRTIPSPYMNCSSQKNLFFSLLYCSYDCVTFHQFYFASINSAYIRLLRFLLF